jgi:predicted KAP-like P-loop ATPase
LIIFKLNKLINQIKDGLPKHKNIKIIKKIRKIVDKLLKELIKVAKYNNKIKVLIDNTEALLTVRGLSVGKLEMSCN